MRIAIGVTVLVATVGLSQPNDIQMGKIAAIDLKKPSVTITTDGKDREYLVVENTKVFGSDAKDPAERLKDFKAGMEVKFKATSKDGRDMLVGIMSTAAAKQKDAAPPFDSSKLKPLTELGANKYEGNTGGLYPEGKNERPAAHEQAGLALARAVQPLDAAGKAAGDGKIVLLSVGMSNTSQASEAFAMLLARAPERNPRLVFINGAQGGMTAELIQNPQAARGAQYWKES